MATGENTYLNKILEFSLPYLQGKKKRTVHKLAVDIHHHLDFHFNNYNIREKTDLYLNPDRSFIEQNPYFDLLISSTRPSEKPEQQLYRKNIYKGQSSEVGGKVINTLKKIVKSKDWSISYKDSEKPKRLKEGESAEDYTEHKYPFFGSIEAWMFQYALRKIQLDPNALICVYPVSNTLPSTGDYYRPYSYFVPCEDILEYREGEIAIYYTNTTYDYGRGYSDRVIHIQTANEIYEARKTDNRGNYQISLWLKHDVGYLTAWPAGGEIYKIVDNYTVYKSHLNPMLPALDTMAREVSDMDAEVVQHIYSTMWYFGGLSCHGCNGTGKTMNKAGKSSTCNQCKGEGVLQKTPYKDHVYQLPKLGEQAISPPLAGYIEKNVEIVKVQMERIEKHGKRALGAVNLEFLAEQPITNSGVAKAYDQDASNSFIYGVAYQVVEHILKRVYRAVIDFRYKVAVPSYEVRLAMNPKIAVPESFDILSEGMLLEKIKMARESKVSPYLIDEQELAYTKSAFPNNDIIYNKLSVQKTHDPLSGKTESEKAEAKLSGGISQEDYVLSTYIKDFVEKAFADDPEFDDKKFDEQRAILLAMAKDKIKQINAQVIDVNNEPPVGD